MFIALEIVLYTIDKREMGRQFFNFSMSLFFGISLIVAPLKLAVSSPLAWQQVAYFRRGTRKKAQHFFIITLEKPSSPDADLKLAFLRELSSSSRVKGPSNRSLSPSLSFEFSTISELQISGPKKSSIKVSDRTGSNAGFLYNFSKNETMKSASLCQ